MRKRIPAIFNSPWLTLALALVALALIILHWR